MRLNCAFYRNINSIFQSTQPHGLRHRKNNHQWLATIFQSTQPHGLRQEETMAIKKSELFQSTQPHGLRLGLNFLTMQTKIFQSSQPHGLRLGASMITSSWTCFQSTQPHGLRLMLAEPSERTRHFQSTQPHGLRLQITAHFPKILPTFSIFFGFLRNLLTSCHNYGYSCKKFWCERPGNFMFTCLSHQAIYKFFGKIITLSCPKRKTCCEIINQ